MPSWSDDDRPAVERLRQDAARLAQAASLDTRPSGAAWVPASDPHAHAIQALPTA